MSAPRNGLLAITILRGAVTAAAAGALIACGSGQPSIGSAEGSDSAAAPADTTADAAAAADVPEADAGAVPLDCTDLHYEILKVPPTRQAFAAEFGQPERVVSSVEPNRHVPDAVDSLFTVYYPRLVMDIRAPAGGRDMATEVRVEDNRYLAYPGIGIGTVASRVRDVLGEPHEQGDGFLRYQCSEAVEQPVTFRIANGLVNAIEIAYYVD